MNAHDEVRMQDAGRKRLTSYLGECLHERYEPRFPGPVGCMKCGDNNCINRSFTTWDDLGALKEKLMETGKQEYFYWNTRNAWEEIDILNRGSSKFSYWLFTPARFCWLLNQWLKEAVPSYSDSSQSNIQET